MQALTVDEADLVENADAAEWEEEYEVEEPRKSVSLCFFAVSYLQYG